MPRVTLLAKFRLCWLKAKGRGFSSFLHVSSSWYFLVFPLRCLCSQRQEDKWLPLTSSRLWDAAVGRGGDSSPSSPADGAYCLPDMLHFLSSLLKSSIWQRDAVQLQCRAQPYFPPGLLKFLTQGGDGPLLMHFFLYFCLFSVLVVRKMGILLHFRSHRSL